MVAETGREEGRRSVSLPHIGRGPRWTWLGPVWSRFLDDVSLERARGVLFLTIPVMMGIGALAYYGATNEPEPRILAGITAVSGLLALLSRKYPATNLLAAAVFVFLAGAFFAQFEVLRASTKMVGSEVTTRLTGRIVVIERQASGRLRLTVDVVATERPTLRHAPDRVRLTARGMDPALQPGDAISGLVRLFPPQGPVRPDGYDFAFESYFDGRGGTGFFMGDPVAADGTGPASLLQGIDAWVERFRLRLAERIESVVPGARGEIASALITGIRAGIPEEVNEDLRRTGLAHILSISGLHMALVALTVMVSIRAVFALFPVFSSNRPVKKYAAAVALVASGAYLAISGAEVAAQRSFIMLAVMLVAVMMDRSALTMRNLAISTVIILAISPHEIMGPSFQMSFAATGALIAGYAAWNERRRSRPEKRFEPVGFGPGWIGRKLAFYAGGLALTSILAGGATTLYGIWHFQRASPLSLLANLAVMPAVSVLVMPFAVLAAVLMPFGLEWAPLKLMEFGLAITLGSARWLSEMSPLDETGMMPKSGLILLTIALLIAVISTTRIRLLAIPFLAAGLLAAFDREMPAAFVSEDARLVGLRLEDGTLAINRPRPSGFTTQNWQRTLGTDKLRRPTRIDDADPPELADKAIEGEGFLCSRTDCVASLTGQGLVAVLADGTHVSGFCGRGALIVVQDATAKAECPEAATIVLTARDLARRGAAEIRLSHDAAQAPAVRHAVSEPFRPWHAYRAFSRSARGLAPYDRNAARGRETESTGRTGTDAVPLVNSAGSAPRADPGP